MTDEDMKTYALAGIDAMIEKLRGMKAQLQQAPVTEPNPSVRRRGRPPKNAAAPRKRRISKAGREAIAAAARKRWAKYHKRQAAA